MSNQSNTAYITTRKMRDGRWGIFVQNSKAKVMASGTPVMTKGSKEVAISRLKDIKSQLESKGFTVKVIAT